MSWVVVVSDEVGLREGSGTGAGVVVTLGMTHRSSGVGLGAVVVGLILANTVWRSRPFLAGGCVACAGGKAACLRAGELGRGVFPGSGWETGTAVVVPGGSLVRRR